MPWYARNRPLTTTKVFPYTRFHEARSVAMHRHHRWLLASLVIVLAGCSARSVEEEDPPDIEGLCRDYCERIIECDLSPNAEFDTVEGCIHNCSVDAGWGPGCTEISVELFECHNQFECPDFTYERAAQCEPEILAHSNCVPDERP